MRYYILFSISMILFTIVLTFFIPRSKTADARTQELCHWYAERNHQGEIAPERWEKNGTWPDFNWYQSCINHHLRAVPEGGK